MLYYAGLDVSMKTTFVCVVNEKGTVIEEAEVSSTPEGIDSFLRYTGLRIEKIGLESGCLTHYLKKDLMKMGHRVVTMESHRIAAILMNRTNNALF